jgi:hypothetical protein
MLRATGSLARDYGRTFSLSGDVRCFYCYENLSNEKTRIGRNLSVVTLLQSLQNIFL